MIERLDTMANNMIMERERARESEIFDCWIIYYRERICEAANLKQKVHMAQCKYNKALENGNTTEAKRYKRILDKADEKYLAAKKSLELVEQLEKLRVTKQYEIAKHKMLNVVNGDYEDKDVIKFVNTGYIFMQTENYATSRFFAAALFKDGHKVELLY